MSEQHYLQELSDFIDGNPDPRELKRLSGRQVAYNADRISLIALIPCW